MSDVISRKAAIDVLKKAYWDKDIQSARNDPCIVDAMTDWSIRQIKGVPPAQPERKKGKWINVRHGNIAECDQCGSAGRAWMNFCFDCGADMRKDGAE